MTYLPKVPADVPVNFIEVTRRRINNKMQLQMSNKDLQGKGMRWYCAVIFGAGFWLLSGEAFAEKRVALIIGNSGYSNIPKVDNPANDADAMAETLKTLGFALVGGGAQIDLDKSNFDSAIQAFGGQLQDADVSLFYYAGHGIQVRGTNYLVPINANPTREADVDFQMVDVTLVLRQMEASRTRLNLLVLDACRNNPFLGRGLRTLARGLVQSQAPEGTLISYATQPGNVAFDGTDGHSPYTKALAHIVRMVGLNVWETFNEVGLAVKRSTRGSQQPWLSSSPIDRNFYFAGPPSRIDAQTNSAPSAPPFSDAERTWAAIKGTTSHAVLEVFIRRFGDTDFGIMARKRLDELRGDEPGGNVTVEQREPKGRTGEESSTGA